MAAGADHRRSSSSGLCWNMAAILAGLAAGGEVLGDALRAVGVRERRARVLLDERLPPLVHVLVVADPLAVRADRQEAMELLHAGFEPHDALGHLEPDAQQLPVHG